MAQVQQLPRGRHGLSREQVVTSQRGRMLAAMADAVAERGYARTSVSDVIRRAGVSRETFYEQFADKEACFLAAYDGALELLRGHVGRAAAGVGADASPGERLSTALDAYLHTLATEPAVARTFLIEVYAAGPAALRRRAEQQAEFVDLLAGLLGGRVDRFTVEALVAAVSSMVTTRVSVGRYDELPGLRDGIVELATRTWRP